MKLSPFRSASSPACLDRAFVPARYSYGNRIGFAGRTVPLRMGTVRGPGVVAGRSLRDQRALSLIEVMIAMALFFMIVFAILGMVSNTLRNARRLQEEYVDAGVVAAHLAALTNRLEEGSYDFDFGDLYSDYRASYEVTQITNGLFNVDILVENERQRGAPPSTLQIMLFKPDSPTSTGIGLRP